MNLNILVDKYGAPPDFSSLLSLLWKTENSQAGNIGPQHLVGAWSRRNVSALSAMPALAVIVSMPGGEPALMTADTLGALQSQIETKMTIPKAHQALMVNGVKVPQATP